MEKTRMTRVEMFNAIKARVTDNAEMVAFLDHQIELIENKSVKKKFQYRKRYYPVATVFKKWITREQAWFQYRKRYYPVATQDDHGCMG